MACVKQNIDEYLESGKVKKIFKMSRMYRKDGVLGGEERSSPINIVKWLREAFTSEEKGKDHFDYLLKHGVYFRTILEEYPSEIPKPKNKIERLNCHMNSLIYAIQLFDELPEKRNSFYFVTGMYSLESKSSSVPLDRRFFIDHHSFISYNGRVIDPTLIEHPAKFFSKKEYYGVLIPFDQIVSIYDSLAEEGKNISNITCFLDVIREKTRE